MPFKGCLSDACVLMKIERFVLKPLRKIERFVLKQRTFRFADYKKFHGFPKNRPQTPINKKRDDNVPTSHPAQAGKTPY